jgi:hypothetical protein
MMYGAIITFQFFIRIDTPEYHQQIKLIRHELENMDKYNSNEISNSTSTSTVSRTERVLGQLDTSMNLNNTTATGSSSSSSSLQNHNHHDHYHHNKVPNFRYSQVQHLIPQMPTPSESMPICFSFMMCLAVGIAVTGLTCFHMYLIITSQTTIEFHGNMMKKRIASENGNVWYNPYHLGWKRNLEQVWGSFGKDDDRYNNDCGVGGVSICDGGGDDSQSSSIGNGIGRRSGKFTDCLFQLRQFGSFLFVLLPSTREPEFLPIPLKGDIGRRGRMTSTKKEGCDELV